MRPVTTTARTQALQNSQVGKHVVGRDFGQSSGRGAPCAGTEASMTGKGGSTGGWGAGLGVSKLGSECQHCASSCKWLCVYHEGMGEGNGTCHSLCSRRGFSVNSSFQGHALR